MRTQRLLRVATVGVAVALLAAACGASSGGSGGGGGGSMARNSLPASSR